MRSVGLGALIAGVVLLAGCGGSVNPPDAGSDAGSGGGNDSGAPDSGSPVDSGMVDAGQDAGGPVSVLFSYRPSWGGVKSVAVIGGFDAGTDWSLTAPFLELANDDAGNWTGSATLEQGQYLYLYYALGDDAGSATTRHLAVDPTESLYLPCPSGSPSYSPTEPNPCSVLLVPQPLPSILYNVASSATYDGGAAQDYVVWLERDEVGSHHYFVDETTVAADGTFRFQVAPGTYRFQVLYPTWYTKTDAQRDGLVLNAYQRSLSAPFAVSQSDLSLNPTEMSFYGYSAYSPVDGGAALPTTFDFPVVGQHAYAAVYGGMDGGLVRIGDPWWTGTSRTTAPASDVFDGGFTTAQAMEPAARPGEKYFWGTWQVFPKADGGTQWTGESMVFPIVFQ